jgi:hypothetical protein
MKTMKTATRRPAFFLLAALATMALLVSMAFGTVAAPQAHAATTTPTIALSDSTVHPNQKITVTAQGFAPNDTVSLYLDQMVDLYVTLPCDSNGDCSGPLTLPLYSGLQGQHMLLGHGSQADEAIASVSFTLNPAILGETVDNHTYGGPGSGLAISGYAFQPNENVNIYWGDANGTLLGTATSSSDYGIFQLTCVIPTNLAPGKYKITAVRTGQKPATVTTTFTVIPPKLTGPAGVRSGHPLNLSVKGFQGSEKVAFSWNANGGQQLGIFHTRPDGSLVLFDNLITPSAPDGTYTVTASGESSGLQASMSLNIGPGIQLNALVNAGGTLAVTGGGFDVGETLNVYIVGQKSASEVSVTTAADGSFQANVTVPMSLTPAPNYHVVASNSDGSEKAETFFNIVQPGLSWTGILTGPRGDTVAYGSVGSIDGQDFPANEQITLYWNYQQAGQVVVGTATAAADGSFSFDLNAPSSPFVGNATVEAIASTATYSASTQVQTGPAMYINPASPVLGQTVTVNAGSLAPNDALTITLNTGSPVVVGTATTDSNGAFTASFTIPSTSEGGFSTLSASDGTTTISANFVIQVPLSVSPTTGSSGTSITVQAPDFYVSNPSCQDYEPKIFWYDPVTGKSQVLSSQTCLQQPFSVTVTAPANLISGQSYQIELFLQTGRTSSSLLGQATFTAQ